MAGRHAWEIGGDLLLSRDGNPGKPWYKPWLMGWQKSEESNSYEAATNEGWRQYGGESAGSVGTLVYQSLMYLTEIAC